MKKASVAGVEQDGTNEAVEPARIVPIRTETALSQYPIHRLVKKGTLTIKVTNTNERGKMVTAWKVSGSKEYGDPGPLAYKIDSLVVSRHVDEARPNIPEVIRLGSLSEIARETGAGEKNTNKVKNALHQNASAYITAKLTYKGHDGTQRDFEFGGTRYEIIFYGERLPNGEKADAVYVILHRTYRELLMCAKTRPLDYGYLKSLPPASQRFYELISFQMYGALKNGNRRAKYLYSDLCRCAPLTRYFEWEQVKKQLYKIHQPHKKSGYISKIEFEESRDVDGLIDWVMWYTPGPKAKQEYREFNGRRDERTEEPAPPRLVSGKHAKPELQNYVIPAVSPDPPPMTSDCAVAEEQTGLLARLAAEGVKPNMARKLIHEYRDRIDDQLTALPFRRIAEDKAGAGALIKSIIEDWAIPEELKEKKAAESRRAEAAKAKECQYCLNTPGSRYIADSTNPRGYRLRKCSHNPEEESQYDPW